MNFPVANPLQASATVTVVVPAYNHGRYVVEALDSVRNQTFQDCLLFVLNSICIDSGSAEIHLHPVLIIVVVVAFLQLIMLLSPVIKIKLSLPVKTRLRLPATL